MSSLTFCSAVLRPVVLAGVSLSAVVACSSSMEKSYKVAASTAYYKQLSYQHACQGTGGHYPAECSSCERTLAAAAWICAAGETAVKIGYMDPQLQHQLDKIANDLQSCP